MSVEAIAIALHHSRAANASTVAVLIGIANHDGDGGSWPTIATLAHYARVKDRQVQRALTELERLGEIDRRIQDGGTVEIAHYDRPNLYHFILKCPPHCDGSRSHKLICEACGKPMPKTYQSIRFHPACAPADRVTPKTPGVMHDTRGVSPMTPKPSLETKPTLNEEALVPNRARAHEESGAQSATSSGEVFDLAASLRSAAAVHTDTICRGRAGIHGHEFNALSGWCEHCETREPQAHEFTVNEQTGEVA